MRKQLSTNHSYEPIRYEELMEEYANLSTNDDFVQWAEKAQEIAFYMTDAKIKIDMATFFAKNRAEQRIDENQHVKTELDIKKYESYSQILKKQLDSLINVIINLPAPPIKQITQDSDWIYEILFRMTTETWVAINQQSKQNDPPPLRLDIREFARFNKAKGPHCAPPVLNAWILNSAGLKTVPISYASGFAYGRQNTFYKIGTVHFHIFEDRQHLLMEKTVGPKYGSGCVYKIIGSDSKAELEVDPSFGLWAS